MQRDGVGLQTPDSLTEATRSGIKYINTLSPALSAQSGLYGEVAQIVSTHVVGLGVRGYAISAIFRCLSHSRDTHARRIDGGSVIDMFPPEMATLRLRPVLRNIAVDLYPQIYFIQWYIGPTSLDFVRVTTPINTILPRYYTGL